MSHRSRSQKLEFDPQRPTHGETREDPFKQDLGATPQTRGPNKAELTHEKETPGETR